MNKKLTWTIVLIILMIASFMVSATFFAKSNFFYPGTGEVNSDLIKELNDVSNDFWWSQDLTYSSCGTDSDSLCIGSEKD